MSLSNIENKIHDLLLEHPHVRHFISSAYSRFSYTLLPKVKSEGNIVSVTPEDGFDYFFGYYDKSPWDETGRFMLCLRAKDARSSPAPDAPAEIIVIDTQDGNSYKTVAKTNAWNSQQGCMAQWLGHGRILYNDFRDGKYCSVILNLETNEETIVDAPVYSVASDGSFALTLDFSRLHRMRPGYGYSNISDASKGVLCPDETCIWRVNLEDGVSYPVLKYTDFFNFEHRPEMDGAEHKVNHIMISPSGRRFMVLHRWVKKGRTYSRLVTCDCDGSGLYNLSDDDFVSHCNWKNDDEIISYLNKNGIGKCYCILKDKSGEYRQIWDELINVDGHPSYSPDRSKIVTDRYPDRQMLRTVYINTEENITRVAKVFSTFKYTGDTRCDLHPRWNHAGDTVCIDACFKGHRGLYVIEV